MATQSIKITLVEKQIISGTLSGDDCPQREFAQSVGEVVGGHNALVVDFDNGASHVIPVDKIIDISIREVPNG